MARSPPASGRERHAAGDSSADHSFCQHVWPSTASLTPHFQDASAAQGTDELQLSPPAALQHRESDAAIRQRTQTGACGGPSDHHDYIAIDDDKPRSDGGCPRSNVPSLLIGPPGAFDGQDFDVDGSDESWDQDPLANVEIQPRTSEPECVVGEANERFDQREDAGVPEQTDARSSLSASATYLHASSKAASSGRKPQGSSHSPTPTKMVTSAPRPTERSLNFGASRFAPRLTLQPLSALGTFRPQQQPPRRNPAAAALRHRWEERPGGAGEPLSAPGPPVNSREQEYHRNLASSDLDEALGDLADKIRRKHEAESAKRDADREALNNQLNQALRDQQVCEHRSQVIEQERDSLSITVVQQTAEIASYESKTSRLKVFVDGLGNDLLVIKKDSDVNHRKHEEFVSKIIEWKASQDALIEQMSACAEKSMQLKTEALKAFRDAATELASTNARVTHLEGQLHDKSRLLAEERELRLALQSQVSNDGGKISDSIAKIIRAGTDSVLDKLFEVHGVVAGMSDKDAVTEMLEKISAAIRGLNSQQSAGVDDIACIKALVQDMGSQHGVNDIGRTIRTYLDEAVQSLRANAPQQQQASSNLAVADAQGVSSALREQIAEELRAEISSHAMAHRATENAHSWNQNKRLAAEVARLTGDVKCLDEDKQAARKEIEELQARENHSKEENARWLEDLQEQWKGEVESHKRVVRRLEDELSQARAKTVTLTSSPPTTRETSAVQRPATRMDATPGSGTDIDRDESLPSLAAFNDSQRVKQAFTICEDVSPPSSKRSMPPPNSSRVRVRQRQQTPETPSEGIASTSPDILSDENERSKAQSRGSLYGKESTVHTVKRKARSQMVEGFEHDRKQHAASNELPSARALSQPSLMARPSSVRDLPTLQPSRLRSSAGSAIEKTRAKKMTRCEQINARFARELDGH